MLFALAVAMSSSFWGPAVAKQYLKVELYYGDSLDGQWHDVTAADEVYTRDPVTITRNASGQLNAQLTLKSLNGKYNPRNAASPLYGKIGRNTPIRISLRSGDTVDAEDAFEGTVVNGWGTADIGGSWTRLTAGGDSTWFSLNGGFAKHDVKNANAFAASYLNDISLTDVTQAVTFYAPQATGADLEVAGLMARGTDINNYVLGRVHLTTGNAVILKIYSADDTLLGETTVEGMTHTGTGAPRRVKMSTAGREVMMKIWNPAAAEPVGWNLHVVDTTAAPVAGFVGVRSGRASGNTNSSGPQFEYDDYEAIAEDPRFVGEVSSWKPRRAIKGDEWTEVEASGVLRRLGQGDEPLRSAAYRAITAAGPTAYWPLEDAQSATAADAAVAGVAAMRPLGVSRFEAPVTGAPLPPAGLPKFAANPGPDGSAPLVSLQDDGLLAGNIPALSDTPTSWQVDFVARFDVNAYDTSAGAGAIAFETNGTYGYWYIDFTQTSVTLTISVDRLSGGTAGGSGQTAPYDGAAHHYRITGEQSGGDIVARLYVDGVLYDTATLLSDGVSPVPGTLGEVTSVLVNPNETRGDYMAAAIGHVTYFTPMLATATADDLVEAVHGRPGETAGRRIERLCTEESVPFTSGGDLDDTQPMGPQRVQSFVSLIAECQRTDDGILYEPRTAPVLHYVPGRSLYNQTAALTLDFVAEQIAPPLDPIVDDLDVFNDVTAVSPTGASAQKVRESGPMNVQAPGDDTEGIGRYSTQVDVNPVSELLLPDQAGWHLNKGTVDETRYQRLTVDLDANPSLATATGAVNPGGVVEISNLEADTVALMVAGHAETIGSHRRMVTFECMPASPYRVAELEHADLSFIGSDLSTVASDFEAGTDTTLDVSVSPFSSSNYSHPWTDDDGPFDIMAAGVRLHVTAVSAFIPLYRFTVDQVPVNGITKTIPSGARVDIYPRSFIGL